MPKNNFKIKQAGATMLEFALTLPFVFVLTVGALDIFRLLQAKNALHEAVGAAIRCSSTTDGKCVTTTAPDFVKQYKFLQLPISEKLVRLSGVGSWVMMPDYRMDGFNADIVGSGEYTGDFKKMAAVPEVLPVEGQVRYFLESFKDFAPVVDDPGHARTSTLSNSTVIGSFSSGSVSGESNSCIRKKIGEITLKNIPSMEKIVFGTYGTQIRCYGLSYNSNNRCKLTSNSITPLMFRILGSAVSDGHNTGSSVGGKITVDVEGISQNRSGSITEIASIGGKVFQGYLGPNDASLALRGLPDITIGKAWVTDPPDGEINLYSNLLTTPGSNIKLTFYLQRTTDCSNPSSPPARWTLDKLEVHTLKPYGEESFKPCQSNLKRSQLTSPNSAAVTALCRVAGLDVVQKIQQQPGSSPIPFGAPLTSDCHTNNFSKEDLINKMVQQQGLPAGYSSINELYQDYSQSYVSADSNQCTKTASFTDCAEPNYGVEAKPVYDSEHSRYFIADSTEARTACASKKLQQVLAEGNTLSDVKFFEKNISVLHQPIFARMQDCTYTKTIAYNSLPSGLSVYKKINFAFNRSGATAMYTGATSPQVVTQSDQTRYGCAAVTIQKAVYNESSDVAQDSLFKHDVFESAAGCNWQAVANAEAVKLGLDSHAYFESAKTDTGEGIVPEPPAENSCARWDISGGSNIPPTDRGTYPVGGTIPAQCIQSVSGVNTCVTQDAGIKKVNPSSDPYLRINNEANKTLRSTFGAFFGGADTVNANCGVDSKNCLKADVQLDPVSKMVTAKAEITVPLMLGRFVSANLGKVSEVSSKPWEGKFAKG